MISNAGQWQLPGGAGVVMRTEKKTVIAPAGAITAINGETFQTKAL
jgi:hypothetical protein